MSNQEWTPVTHENCNKVQGPFYHGTKCQLEPGDLLVPGRASNFEAGRVSHNVYFSAALDAAVWGRSWPHRWRDWRGLVTFISWNQWERSRTTPT